MGKRYFSDKIVEWYLNNRRPLPWRETTNPYHIWLSEVILQQTRVSQGLPYYQQFVESFPSVIDLAHASEQEVLRLWQGLGYYTRARNLHKCAKEIAELNGGLFPTTARQLEALPGIGDYTAAAIASFAFGEVAAVLDGNVYRILSRIFGIDTPINSPEGKRVFSSLAAELISKENPALHNQGVMEFGATFCTPVNPKCAECPFKDSCVALHRGLINHLPVKIRAKKSRKRYFFYLVIKKGDSLLMRKRQAKDIWNGLFDFLLIEKNKPVKAEKLISDAEHRKWMENARRIEVSKSYKHVLTHQTIHCRFINIQAEESFTTTSEDMAFYTRTEIARLPKPALITRFLQEQNGD
jgi:A/G-specific adenine glycosylase